MGIARSRPLAIIAEFLGARKIELILATEILLYIVVFSYVSIIRYLSFAMYAWDLGVYHQAFYTTVQYGRFFFSTVELPYTEYVVPLGTEFAVHFSPIFFLILPIYAVFPSPITLLVIKTVALALGAVPVFLLARRAFNNSKAGLALSTAYMVLPALHGINWYDFQPHAFFPVFALSALYFLERERPIQCVVFLLLALSTIEVAAFWGIALGVMILYSRRKETLAFLHHRNIRGLMLQPSMLVIYVSLGWLALVYAVSVLFGWQGAFHPSSSRRFADLQDTSVLGAISFDLANKLLYVGLLFGPLAFIAFFDIPKAAVASLWVVVAVSSSYPPFYQLTVQYPAFVVPFMVYASIYGIIRCRRRLEKAKWRWLTAALAGSLIASAIAASPLGPFNLASYPGAGPFGLPEISEHDRAVASVLSLIPREGSVITQNNLFPHVSNRLDAFVLPFTATFRDRDGFNATLGDWLDRSEFILVDSRTDPISSTLAFERVILSGDFGVYAEADGTILFRRGHRGPPILYSPLIATIDVLSLAAQTGSVVSDPDAIVGRALCRDASVPAGDFWYGPGLFIATGNYSVTFRLKVDSPTPDDVLALAVVAWPARFHVELSGSEAIGFVPSVQVVSGAQEIVAARSVGGSEFGRPATYEAIELLFSVAHPSGFEFVGLNTLEGIGICLDSVKVTQLSP